MSGKNQRGRVAGEWAAKYGTVEVGLREKEERCVKVRGIIGVGIFKGDVGLTKREIGVQGGLWGETKALRAGAFHLHQPQIITPFMWYFSDMFHSIFICLIINTVSGESSLMLCLHSSSYRHFPSVPSLLFFLCLAISLLFPGCLSFSVFISFSVWRRAKEYFPREILQEQSSLECLSFLPAQNTNKIKLKVLLLSNLSNGSYRMCVRLLSVLKFDISNVFHKLSSGRCTWITLNERDNLFQENMQSSLKCPFL